jgi:[acyl-carrier-protein] S-malonyltransferase
MRTKGFLFPGYGSQYVGMGKDFYDKYRIVQELFEEASNCTGLNFIRLCFASSEKELAQPLNAYLSLFLIQASLFSVLKEHEIFPRIITGWGVGQVSVYYASGVLNFPDGLYFLKKYLEFFERLVRGYDASIISIKGIDRNILNMCRVTCNVEDLTKLAIIREEKDLVVAGTKKALDALSLYIKKNFDVKIENERYTYGIHLLFINEMVENLNLYLEKIDCKKPQLTFVDQSGVMFKKGCLLNKLYLTEFMYHPIDIMMMVKKIDSVGTIVQIGPGKTTLDVLDKYFPHKKKFLIKNKSDIKELL